MRDEVDHTFSTRRHGTVRNGTLTGIDLREAGSVADTTGGDAERPNVVHTQAEWDAIRRELDALRRERADLTARAAMGSDLRAFVASLASGAEALLEALDGSPVVAK
jgi:hypothetical protein